MWAIDRNVFSTKKNFCFQHTCYLYIIYSGEIFSHSNLHLVFGLYSTYTFLSICKRYNFCLYLIKYSISNCIVLNIFFIIYNLKVYKTKALLLKIFMNVFNAYGTYITFKHFNPPYQLHSTFIFIYASFSIFYI